jgi:hypothetical protein
VVGLSLFALKIWSLPALVVALLIGIIARFRGIVTSWNVLAAAMATIGLDVFTEVAIGADALAEAPLLFFVGTVVLFVGIQLSLFMGRSVGKLPI